ncbi:energy transducer TonB [Hymenobacter cavernae]|uniref:Cell envelope biogenesis protein TonB n=1 Tax=Hymenobacter cavernae TaxID=2044852 RepID=A0ABQ1UEZ7_9BACT|nr:energy transducer TonB [Hymenobacter cavernae]GGF16170.1 cell envelope biogenesis protein TonB [Hymenobacter cavernae]
MTLLNLLTATLDDIIFERRNKAYGAFVLRRLYNRHLATAITIASVLCFLLVAIPMLVQQLWPAELAARPPKEDPINLTHIVLPPKPVQPTVRSESVHPPMVRVLSQPTAPKVVANDKVKPEPKNIEVAPPVVPPGAIAGPEDLPGDIDATATGPASTAGNGADTKEGTAPAAPFVYAEVMPEFTGGTEALRRYMQRNLHYPSAALANSVAGQVFVSFVVNTDGSISNVEVLKGLGFGTDEEAARVVRNMPAWKPGRQNSHAVAVRYTLPITFRYE